METNQLLSKTTILHAFSIIRHVIDVSHNLNSNLTWIYLKFFWVFHRADWDFTALVTLFYHKFVIRKFSLPFSSLVMETNSFTRLKFHTPISNLKLKKMVSYLKLLPLYEDFAKDVHSRIVLYYCDWVTCHLHWCCTRIKRVQIGFNEIKEQVLPITPPVFYKRY